MLLRVIEENCPYRPWRRPLTCLQKGAVALNIVLTGAGGWIMGSCFQSEEEEKRKIYFAVGIPILVTGVIVPVIFDSYSSLRQVEGAACCRKVCAVAWGLFLHLGLGGIAGTVLGLIA